MQAVAQLVRAPDCGSGGRRFDSGRSAHIGASPSGKARDFDSRMRWFESSRPSHLQQTPVLRGSLLPLHGPLAQGQSIRLLSGVSLVRIQHGPPWKKKGGAVAPPISSAYQSHRAVQGNLGCFCVSGLPRRQRVRGAGDKSHPRNIDKGRPTQGASRAQKTTSLLLPRGSGRLVAL